MESIDLRFQRRAELLRLLITFALVSVFLTPTVGQKSEQARDYYNRGLQNQESGDLDGALPAYDKALEVGT